MQSDGTSPRQEEHIAALERELRQTRAQLQQMTDMMNCCPAVVLLWEPAPGWRVTFATENVTQLGYTPDDLLSGRVSWEDLLAPEDRSRVEAEMADYARQGILQYTQEYRIRTKSGDNRLVEDYRVAVLDAAGKLTHYQGTLIDITARMHTETALHAHEAFLKHFFEHVPAAVAMFDNEMRYIAASRRWMTDYRLDGRDIIGLTHYEVFPEIGERWKALHRRALAGETLRCAEDPFPRADGTLDWVRWEIEPWRHADGSIGGMIMFTEVITERKRAEETLRESEEWYRDLFEGSPISIWEEDFSAVKAYLDQLRAGGVVDFRAYFDTHPEDVLHLASLVKVTDINQQSVKLFHATSKETVVRELPAYFNERSLLAFRDEMVALVEGKLNFDAEIPIRMPDGKIVIMALSLCIVERYRESWSRVLVSFIDITQRVQAEEALRQSVVRYRHLFEDSPISLWEEDLSAIKCEFDHLRAAGITDFQTYFRQHPEAIANLAAVVKVNSVNKATLALYQATSLADFSHGLQVFFTEESYDVFLEGIIKYTTGCTAFEGETTQRTLQGEIRDVTLRSVVVPGYENTLEKVIVTIVDITERKQAEERAAQLLQRAEQQAAELNATLDAIADGLLLYTPDLEVVRMNPAAECILGATKQHLPKTAVERLLYLRITKPDGTPLRNDENPATRAARGETTYNMPLTLTTRDGRTVWVSVSAAPICLPDGKLIGEVLTLSDITELHHLQQQQEDFLHIVSHDLRLPLTVIHGHMQLLEPMLQEAGIDGDMWSSIDAIDRSVQRMTVMIQDLVDAARLAGGQITLDLTQVKLDDYLANLLERMKASLEVERITMDISPDLPPVLADYDRLERILLNLLSNALKYSPPESPVLIRARRSDGEVVISVIDQGQGIAPEDLPHLFQRFYRGKEPQKAEGIGLGLYITRLLVEAHGLSAEAQGAKVGGRIWVVSELGKGSTFSFTLPST